MIKQRHILTYSVACTLAVLVFLIGIYLLELKGPIWNNLLYLIYIGVLIFAVKSWRDSENEGVISFASVMSYATFFAIYYLFVIAIWTYLFMVYVAPDLMEIQLQLQEQMMVNDGMPPEQIAIAMKYARMFSKPPIAAIFTFIGGLFIASILNLIVAAIMKKDKEVSFNNY